MTTKRAILCIAIWIAAIAIAACFDESVARFVRDAGIARWMVAHPGVASAFKVFGLYWCTLIFAVVATFVHPLKWKAGAFLLLATVVSGVNGLIKWIVGRTRPFKLDVMDADGQLKALPFQLSPFRGGIRGLAESKNLCFPSGHAALAFATAAALAMLWPRAKWRCLAFLAAAFVAVERVSENAHWLSDTVAAAALGIGGVHLIHWIVTKVFVPEADEKATTDS